MAQNREESMNYALARVLRTRHPLWDEQTVHAEQTDVLKDVAKTPDVLVEIKGRQPVAIEAEVDPAAKVEEEARGRLGAISSSTNERIDSALAVVYPKRFRDGDKNLDEAIASATDLRYAAFQEGGVTRWPESGWIETDVNGLADAIEILSLSERKLAQGTRKLEELVKGAANKISANSDKNHLKQIADKLYQDPGEQTNRMAAAIFVSAFIFHTAIAGKEQTVKEIVDGKEKEVTKIVPALPKNNQLNVVAMTNIWDEIIGINYEPIFQIACELLNCLPDKVAKKTMALVREGVSELADLGVATYHDLAGQMFQELITDHEFLATYYTLPVSAHLLAELALRRCKVDWSDASAIKDLKIADFACGTGALLRATQQAVYSRHRRARGDDKELHVAMMENILIGMDIMPAATHLTCSMLSSAHPSTSYGKSQIYTVTYGSKSKKMRANKKVRTNKDKKFSIGSLDLLDPEPLSINMLDTGITTMQGRGDGKKSNKFLAPPNEHCDLVIMNPPFKRPTNHEGANTNIPVPSFAGFNTSDAEQREMSKKLKRIYAKLARKGHGTPVFAGHGNAGLASNFIDLAHAKLKPGGTLALIIPFTFAQGSSWRAARKLLETHYRDIAIVSIATAGSKKRAFSAETGMAEVLIIATRNDRNQAPAPQTDVQFVNLKRRPLTQLEAATVANHIDNHKFQVASGSRISAPLAMGGCAGMLSNSIARAMMGLFQSGNVALPRTKSEMKFKLVKLGEIGKRGVHSRDIIEEPRKKNEDDENENGDDKKPKMPRGPFGKEDWNKGEATPDYPFLWEHKAERERLLIVDIDSQGIAREGCRERAINLWEANASRLHINVDFTLSSQPLAACLTPDESIGGTAWPNFILNDREWEIPVVLWLNSTLGIMSFWWIGTRQQQGRSRLKISQHPELPMIDPRELDEKQLALARTIFDKFKNREFLPVNEAYRDKTRQDLDKAILVDLLKQPAELLKPLGVLRRQWCEEPNVHGGKSTRPRDWSAAQREFAAYVLDNYTRDDINQLDKSKVSEILTDRYGDLADARRQLGGDAEIKALFAEIKSGSYSPPV